jgi:hypothetical protein
MAIRNRKFLLICIFSILTGTECLAQDTLTFGSPSIKRKWTVSTFTCAPKFSNSSNVCRLNKIRRIPVASN